MTILDLYKEIKMQKEHLGSEQLSRHFHNICRQAFEQLKEVPKVELYTKIPDKQFFCFKQAHMTRAVNTKLYQKGSTYLKEFFDHLVNKTLSNFEPEYLTAACYTACISVFAVLDLRKAGDVKSPATFFELFIGHLFSHFLGVKPKNELDLRMEERSSLKTDFIFDLGKNKEKIHLPIKTSTRERVIQVWAHQRVIDGIYGNGAYKGIMVCFAETKTNKKTLEVTEICIPHQWRVYQSYISRIEEIYYLDPPQKYLKLNSGTPKINVQTLGNIVNALTPQKN